MTSASSSSSSRGGKSPSSNSGLMDAQKLLASIALSRPTPFGDIPRRMSHQHQHQYQQQRASRHTIEEPHSTRKRPSSAHGSEHNSAQIFSFATRRPSEPQISTSISPPPTTISNIPSLSSSSTTDLPLHGSMDVKLNDSDAFEYEDEIPSQRASSSSHDGLDSLPLSPASPSEEWDERLSTTSTSNTRSRQATSSRSRESTSPSTPTSSRSSSLRRKPSLLNQHVSLPTSSSQCIAVNGRQSTPTLMMNSSVKDKQSQSLAERGHSVEASIKANMPELYTISRGRSDRVSPSRRWDRRGASASVLSAAGLDDENSESTLTPSKIVRKESTGSLEHALFNSDDDGELFQTSDDNDDEEEVEIVHERMGEDLNLQGSRRSSIDRDRRRELRILLAAPSTIQESGNGASEKVIGHSLGTAVSGTSIGTESDKDDLSHEKGSNDTQHDKFSHHDLQILRDPAGPDNDNLADDESDAANNTLIASMINKRSRKGKEAFRSTLKSLSPPNRVALDVILAGMTPSEERDSLDIRAGEEKKEDDLLPSSFVSRSSAMSSERTSSSVRPMSINSVPVDADSDPLLGQSFGSVADNMQVDAVEWNDNSSVPASNAGSGPSTPKLNGAETSKNSRRSSDVRKTVAEQEDERRMGFAAAYQQRLSALSMRLWSNGKSGRSREKSVEISDDSKDGSKSKSPEKEHEAKTTSPPADSHPSLFTSSWRHLAMLPNLLLAPALGTASPNRADVSTDASYESEEYSSIAQVIETASAHTTQRSSDLQNDRDAALQAAQKAVAHLASIDPKAHPPMIASRTIVAIDRALDEMHKDDVPSTPTMSHNKQDSSHPTANRKRSGRGVMTPLEADADVSAYVSGLGLPIDPDVELSSVVHLQTFRSDTRARRSTSVSRESTVGMPKNVEAEKRENNHKQHKRTFSDTQKQRSPPFSSKMVTPSVPAIVEGSSPKDFAEAQFEKILSNKRGSREPIRELSSRRAATVRAPKCSRPAVQAPVPGNYSAYNSSASDEDVQSDRESDESNAHKRRNRRSGSEIDAESDQPQSRGRGRTSSKRSTSPLSNQQCAIGLFSSTSSHSSRSKPGRYGRNSGRNAATEENASVLRVRSSPNLSAMNYEEELESSSVQVKKKEEEELFRKKTQQERAEGRDSRRVGGRQRGRGDGVKRVSASLADGGLTMKPLIRSNSMSDLPLLNAKLIVSSAHASSLASNGAIVSNSNGLKSSLSPNGATLLSSSHSSPSADAALRLPFVGAGNIPHLAGRPSMVSNGAHLLMLSLELEMMRNRKITGSLKPRWLKARMRTELFGPAAIVAMMAAERQNTSAALIEMEEEEEGEEEEDKKANTDAAAHKHHHRSRTHHQHEHKAHIGVHTAHHSAIHHGQHHHQHGQHLHHGMQANVTGLRYNQPKNRSSLRFELE